MTRAAVKLFWVISPQFFQKYKPKMKQYTVLCTLLSFFAFYGPSCAIAQQITNLPVADLERVYSLITDKNKELFSIIGQYDETTEDKLRPLSPFANGKMRKLKFIFDLKIDASVPNPVSALDYTDELSTLDLYQIDFDKSFVIQRIIFLPVNLNVEEIQNTANSTIRMNRNRFKRGFLVSCYIKRSLVFKRNPESLPHQRKEYVNIVWFFRSPPKTDFSLLTTKDFKLAGYGYTDRNYDDYSSRVWLDGWTDQNGVEAENIVRDFLEDKYFPDLQKLGTDSLSQQDFLREIFIVNNDRLISLYDVNSRSLQELTYEEYARLLREDSEKNWGDHSAEIIDINIIKDEISSQPYARVSIKDTLELKDSICIVNNYIIVNLKYENGIVSRPKISEIGPDGKDYVSYLLKGELDSSEQESPMATETLVLVDDLLAAATQQIPIGFRLKAKLQYDFSQTIPVREMLNERDQRWMIKRFSQGRIKARIGFSHDRYNVELKKLGNTLNLEVNENEVATQESRFLLGRKVIEEALETIFPYDLSYLEQFYSIPNIKDKTAALLVGNPVLDSENIQINEEGNYWVLRDKTKSVEIISYLDKGSNRVEKVRFENTASDDYIEFDYVWSSVPINDLFSPPSSVSVSFKDENLGKGEIVVKYLAIPRA